MARYFTQRVAPPRADDDDWYARPLIVEPYVPEHHPIDTGLLDIRGAAIMRAPNPIGFGRDADW